MRMVTRLCRLRFIIVLSARLGIHSKILRAVYHSRPFTEVYHRNKHMTWEDNWDILSTFFAYPVEIRKIIYTTNIIEGLNRQFRKVTKTKSVFPTDDSLRKMLYLASRNITKKWTQRYKNWDIVIRQLEIMHEEKTA